MKQKQWILYGSIFILLIVIGIFFMRNPKVLKMQEQETVTEASAESHVVEIYNEEDFLEFAKSVDKGQTYEDWEVELRANLNFEGYHDLRPIGDGEQSQETVIFEGVFDGNGYSISGIHMYRKDSNAGLFACLGGTVRNLQIKDSEFSGNKVGAIAADTEEASIYNCYIDAELTGNRVGMIVSRLSGMIVNCVASEGERYEAVKSGGEYLCYSIGECDSSTLNQNLAFLSGYFADEEICIWGNTEAGIGLTEKAADTLEKVHVKLSANGMELILEGYFSDVFEKWCVALPANYLSKELIVEAQTVGNQLLQLTKPAMESEINVCIDDIHYPIHFLCEDNIDTLYITLEDKKDLSYVHGNKYEEIPGFMTIFEQDGRINQTVLRGFYGHGNDSWKEEKKSYNLKFDDYVNLLGMGANEDFALLAGYRRSSLMSYVTTTELIREIGFEYAPEFRLVNVYVGGEYAGIYFLTEKIKLDKNRIDIPSVYKKAETNHSKSLDEFEKNSEITEGSCAQKHYYDGVNNPNDITGGYLLEIDNEDFGEYDSRFVTERNICVVLKRAMYSSKEQVEYISDFWQDFENALYSKDGYNEKGKYYTEYIDMESFAMQWLMYELEQEISLNGSLYYYKESDMSGDGLIHACYPWDMEHSYVLSEKNDKLWHMDANDGTLEGFWEALYQHDDFKEEVSKIWVNRLAPAVEKLLADDPSETENGFRNLNWYRQNMFDLHLLENSRWRAGNPWDKITTIEEFLRIRLETLTELL